MNETTDIAAVEVVHIQDRPIARANDQRYFELVMRQAEVLADSRIIPKAYQRSVPDIIAAGLAGRAFGWDVMASMRSFHVVEGTASMRPEAMLALVRAAGHSVALDVSDGAVAATGVRSDNNDSHVAVFSMNDAKRAGLAGKHNWKTYPEAMLTWRAVSKLCRVLFPDVVLGAGMVPEELGAEVTPAGDPLVPPAIAKTEILALVGGDVDAARAAWGDRGSNPISADQLDEILDQLDTDPRMFPPDPIQETEPTPTPEEESP